MKVTGGAAMKISELIRQLQRVATEYGDVEVAWRGYHLGSKFEEQWTPDVDVDPRDLPGDQNYSIPVATIGPGDKRLAAIPTPIHR